PRVRGGGPGVGRLLRRLRESDAADVAALRHQSEPGAGVRGRVSRFHVPADHAARPALACECPPPPGRPGSGTDSRSTGGPETVTDAVRVAAHAKLNLLLRILAREAPAGYHQIETAFALLELADELMVTRTASGVALTVQGPDLGAPEQNLAVRAARARVGPGRAAVPAPRPAGRASARGAGAPAHRRRHPGRVRLVGRNASRARAARAAAARRRRVHRMGQRRAARRQRLRAPRLREASAAARAVRAPGRHTSL